MTGYGVGIIKRGEQECQVEIKTVNNKYCDISIKNSFNSLEIEQKIESMIKEKIARGKINVIIRLNENFSSEEKVIINEKICDSYLTAFKNLKEKYKFEDEISLKELIKFKDIFQIVREERRDQAIRIIEEAVKKALVSLIKMREKEGKILIRDIQKRIKKIIRLVDRIEKYSSISLVNFHHNFQQKIKNLTSGLEVDEGRIELEAALIAEKMDINEEIVRERSHLLQLNNLFRSTEPIGRKMDFLLQEINREINTIGSKCNDLKITSLVVEIKSELERIREQARNIE